MKTRPVTVSILCLLSLTFLFLVACGGEEAEPTPTPSPLQLEIEEAISQFEAQDIDTYTMRVTYRRRRWNPQVIDLEVVDGEATIVDQDCIPGQNCYIQPDLDANDFTLPAIFAVIREQATLHEGIFQITYHDEYGFPRIVATAEEGAFEISNFQPAE